MVGETGRLRRGVIHLGDDDEPEPGTSNSPVRTRSQWLTVTLYWLMMFASVVGLGSLLFALSIIDGYDWGDGGPFFHRVFKEKFSPVSGLLLMSVFWAPINLLSLRKEAETLPSIFSTAYDIFMIITLIYFPTVCCSWLYDRWSTLACEYLDQPGFKCMPIYTKILQAEITGLVCAYLVALFYLLLIVVRVVSLIVDLHGKGRSRPLGRWLYQRGYSTDMAIYCISTSLAIVGFSLMMWVYSSLPSVGRGQNYGQDVWADHFRAGFGILTILLFSVPSWFLANLFSLWASRKALSTANANSYDLFVGVGLIWISLRAAKFLDHLEWLCGENGNCRWIWTGLRPRYVAVIVLGMTVGVIHLVLFLIRLSVHINSRRGSVHAAVPIVLLHELDTSTWSEYRVAALRYALRDPESDPEDVAAVETEVDEQQPDLGEIFPFLSTFGQLFENARVALLGLRAPHRNQEEEGGGEEGLWDEEEGDEGEEEDDQSSLLAAGNEEVLVAEAEVDAFARGDVAIESGTETAIVGEMIEHDRLPVDELVGKPLPPPPPEDESGEENRVEI